MLTVYDYGMSTHRDFDFNHLIEHVLTDFRIARHNVTLEAGEYPVIMSPEASKPAPPDNRLPGRPGCRQGYLTMERSSWREAV